MKQVTLIRGYVRNRLVPQLRVWISTLPETELMALQLLEGETGFRTAEKISEYVLFALGHRLPEEEAKPLEPTEVVAVLNVAAQVENAVRGRKRLPERHGTPNQYKLGCRCEPCTEAVRKSNKDYRDRKAAKVAV